MIAVGVYGGSGYMGGEVIRVLLEHPHAQVAWITSRGDKPVEYFHRNFIGKKLRFVKPDKTSSCDVIFAALPAGQLMRAAPALLESNARIIDLGADFRLKNKMDWERIYGMKHESWHLTDMAVYGVTELHRNDIKRASLVANPGCYASAAILALAPLVKAGYVDTTRLVIDGLSGTTGAGAEPDVPLHHPEIANNIVPYNVVDHRHSYEIEQELQNMTLEKVTVHLTTHYVPITRGILAVCHCFPKASATKKELINMFTSFYREHPFIEVMDMPKEKNAKWQYLPYPWISAVSGTNYCHIGMDVDEIRNRIVVFAVLDSIGKGGSHVGVQNMNLMFGLPEETGLARAGMHPY